MMPRRIISYPKWVKIAIGSFVGLCVGLNIIFPLPIEKIRYTSPVVTDHQGQWLSAFSVEDGIWRISAKLSEIDPRFIERVIAVEDQRFWQHNGVDFPAIIRAVKSWRQAGRPVSGASTITMQLVRQIEPRPRTLKSKFIESLRALQYEFWFSKTDILELYLTHISYGGNIEGIYAASLSYFGKLPFQLTDSEIALLIALPQAPEARRPDLHPESAQRGRDLIIDKQIAEKLISPLQGAEAKSQTIQIKRQAIPEQAWITSYGLASDGHSTSTLDFHLQSEMEYLAHQFVEGLEDQANLALIIVDNNSMDVRAHIASGKRDRPGGWIDMTNRSRSPGSTLKPFIYGAAIDEGVVSAGAFIHDAPTRFGRYQPENFNRRYHGDVRIYEALRHSLNVPAVAVLDMIGDKKLAQTLKNSGVDLPYLKSSNASSGLALALGGVGISVNDLAILYAALANEGLVRPLRWVHDDLSSPAPYRLMSAKAARDITGALRQAPTPEGRVPSWLSDRAPPIAYKTGTSYGFRDAWAAGYTDEWTVIIWVGRPDGAPRIGETGRTAAAPLLFDIMARLPYDGRAPIYQKDEDAPMGLQRVRRRDDTGLQILFPPSNTELYVKQFGKDGRGLALSARSTSDNIRFYVDEEPIKRQYGQAIWYPEYPGFYDITAIDDAGQRAEVNVEIMTLSR